MYIVGWIETLSAWIGWWRTIIGTARPLADHNEPWRGANTQMVGKWRPRQWEGQGLPMFLSKLCTVGHNMNQHKVSLPKGRWFALTRTFVLAWALLSAQLIFPCTHQLISYLLRIHSSPWLNWHTSALIMSYSTGGETQSPPSVFYILH